MNGKRRSLKKPLALAVVLAVGAGFGACTLGNGVDKPKNSQQASYATSGVLEGQPKGDYVGSAVCMTCHQDEYKGWAETVHGDMIRVASEETMIPWARERFLSLLESDPNHADLKIGRDHGQLQSLDQIKYVVGGKWKQRYLVKTDEGHVFLTRQFYDSSTGAEPNPRFHDYGAGRVYEDRCLDCHSTGLDMNLVASADRTASDYTLGSVVSELGIGCEKCHGTGKEHASAPSSENILNPANFSINQQTQFCGTCHGRNAGHATLAGREDAVGFKLGDENLHEVVKMLDVTDASGNLTHNPGVGFFAGSNQRFYADGASRSHRQEYNDLLQGPHAGKLSCTTCHDVHRGNTLKADNAVALCATCHDGGIAPGRQFTQADIDAIMPKRSRSTNLPDIATHTFLYGGIGKPAADIPRNDAGKAAADNARAQAAEAAYIGSRSCNSCHASHRSAHAGWSGTVHGKMIQEAEGNIEPKALGMLQKALNPATSGQLISGGALDGKPYSDLLKYGPHASGTQGSITSLDEIKYVVGGKWKQRYVVKTDVGHLFLQWQFYDSPEGTNPRAHSYGEVRAYEDRCLACHSTGLDMDLVASVDRTAADYTLKSVLRPNGELGVGCESCHGPGSLHRSNIFSAREKGLASIINPARFSAVEQFDACGSCHARNDGHQNLSGRNDAPGFLIGDKLDDHVKVTRFEKTPGRFHADGAGSSHRMQYNDMEQGPKAGMSCSTCHDVHKGNLLKADFDALCASCHGPGHGYEIDKVMPKRARSSNVPDIHTHTFILGADGTAVGNQK